MELYLDIGIGAIFLIAIIVGVIRGFAKQFSKGLCGFIAFVGSIGITIILIPYIATLAPFKSAANAMSGWFTDEMFVAPIESQEQLVEFMSSGFIKILSGLSGRIWSTMETYELSTLGGYCGILTAKAIAGLILWILLLLAIKYSLLGIKLLMEKLSKKPVLHTLDKLFGVIWAVGISYIVVTIVITLVEIVIIKWTPAAQEPLANAVNNSHIFQFLHGTNVIGSFVANLFKVDLLTLTTIA